MSLENVTLGCVDGVSLENVTLGCVDGVILETVTLGCVDGVSLETVTLVCVDGVSLENVTLGCVDGVSLETLILGCAGGDCGGEAHTSLSKLTLDDIAIDWLIGLSGDLTYSGLLQENSAATAPSKTFASWPLSIARSTFYSAAMVLRHICTVMVVLRFATLVVSISFVL